MEQGLKVKDLNRRKEREKGEKEYTEFTIIRGRFSRGRGFARREAEKGAIPGKTLRLQKMLYITWEGTEERENWYKTLLT